MSGSFKFVSLTIPVFLSLIFIVSCRPKDEKLHPDQPQTTDSISDTLAARKLVYHDCNAIVVGEGVRLRSKPELKSEVIAKLNTGTLLKVIKTSDKQVLMGDPGYCRSDGYFWHEVITSEGDIGWIYGEFLYNLIMKGRNDELATENERLLMSKGFYSDGKRYSLGFAFSENQNLMVTGEDTLCVPFLMPFFYRADQGNVFPVRLIQNPKNKIPFYNLLTDEKNYLRFTRGGKNDDGIEFIREDSQKFLVTIGRDVGDDEPFWYTLVIKPGESFFSGSPTDPGKEYLP